MTTASTVLDVTFRASDVMGILPVLILCFFAIVAILLEVFAQRDGDRSFIANISVVGLLLAFGANCLVWESGQGAFSRSLFGDMLALDAYGTFFNAIFLSGGLLAVLLSKRYCSEHKIQLGEYYSLILFGVVGMSLMAAAVDLIILFVALEIMSVGLYVLTGFLRSSRKSAEAALKYFLMGAFASGILLYGVALIYGATGSTNLQVIGRVLESDAALAHSTLVRVAMALLIVGLGFKIAAAPFHLWAPDVYEGAPTPITAFMSVGVKAAGFAALLRLFTVGFGGDTMRAAAEGTGWVGVLYLMAVLTMFAGNLAALPQTNVKRMLAYSSVSHVGYLLVGVVAAASDSGAADANSAVLFYLLAYTFSTFLVFGVIALFGRGGEEYTHLSDFAGVGFSKPFLGLALMVGLLSLAGIPPLGGFFAKFYLFREALGTSSPDILWLVILAIVNSMIALYYYLRVIVFLYMKEAARPIPIFSSGGATAVLVISLAVVLVLGVFPEDYLEMARRSVLSLGLH